MLRLNFFKVVIIREFLKRSMADILQFEKLTLGTNAKEPPLDFTLQSESTSKKKEDRDGSEIEDRPQEHEDSSAIFGMKLGWLYFALFTINS